MIPAFILSLLISRCSGRKACFYLKQFIVGDSYIQARNRGRSENMQYPAEMSQSESNDSDEDERDRKECETAGESSVLGPAMNYWQIYNCTCEGRQDDSSPRNARIDLAMCDHLGGRR
jgi:hypothetical protein